MTLPAQILWTTLASTQLGVLHKYISEDSPTAADNQTEIVLQAVERLLDFPDKGRPGRCARTRELVVPGTPYIVAYRVRTPAVEILAIIHGARRWPQRLG